MTEPAQPGIVYIFTNEAMPGYVKIGMTQADDVAARLKQLDTTAVPLPFECRYAARVRTAGSSNGRSISSSARSVPD